MSGRAAAWRARLLTWVMLALPGTNLIVVGRVVARAGAHARGEPDHGGAVPWTTELRLGVGALVGSALWLLPALLSFGGAWFAGWTVSYDGISNASPAVWALGSILGIGSVLVAVPALAALPLLQAHHASTGRLSAYADVRTLLGLVAGRPGAVLAPAALVPTFFVLHVLLRFAARQIDVPGAVLADVVLNGIAYEAFLRVKLSWAGRYRSLASTPGASTPGAATAAARWRIGATFATLLSISILLAALHAVQLFIVSAGLFDLAHDPLFMIPSVPYPLGLVRPGWIRPIS